ncbi:MULTISPECIES: hypothetical protein [unclassified Chryseobacterium]|uniref:hypothetical protein n=1 Tax=unclassified Chryseobacterium TaxID=2593645 RepID=UPI002269F127|nr:MULTISPECIES: hypothetical protein [unclassified Chryseobacterium]
MRNYKKLLLAGLAIVPLALSSWTSEDPTKNIRNLQDYPTSQLKEMDQQVGAGFLQSIFTVKSKKTVINVSNMETVEVAESKVTTTIENPGFSLDKLVKDYQ